VSRNYIGFEKGFEALLKDFVFELATSDLSQPVTTSGAQEWIPGLA
jgi:hypothetical protein